MSIDVIELLTEIVKEKGEDYVYVNNSISAKTPRCVYTTSDGEPSCLVGIMLSKVAPDCLATIHELEWNERGYMAGSLPMLHVMLNKRADWPFTDDDITALAAAQNSQDNREPYGSVHRQIQQFYSRH